MDKALDGGNVKIVKLLLEKGSDANAVLVFKGKHKPEEMPDYKDPRVITPLKKAVAAGRADIAAVLLDKGADGAAYFLAETYGRQHRNWCVRWETRREICGRLKPETRIC